MTVGKGIVEYLGPSAQACRVLRALRGGLTHPNDIADRLDVSPSTVERALRRLISVGQARRQPGPLAVYYACALDPVIALEQEIRL